MVPGWWWSSVGSPDMGPKGGHPPSPWGSCVSSQAWAAVMSGLMFKTLSILHQSWT